MSAGYLACSRCGYWYATAVPHVCMADLLTACALPAAETAPLPPAVPPTWAGREARVVWVLANLSPGELARLYELQHFAGQRMDGISSRWRAERDALKGTGT
jgi:hypothetical protein